MKRTILSMAMAIVLSITVAKAQTDTTGVYLYKAPKDMVEVNSTDVPSTIIQSLNDSKYTGWQSGKIYRNPNSDFYYVTYGNDKSRKSYYFDKMGKPMDIPKP